MQLTLVGGACAPAQKGGDSTSGGASSGSGSDSEIAMDWTVYDPWSTGHCIDFRFTNTGEALTDWRFDVGMDAEIRDLSYEGEVAGRLAVSGRTLSVLPAGDAVLPAFASVEASGCFEPAARPMSLAADVTREEDDDPIDPLGAFGSLRDPSERILVTWDQRAARLGDACIQVSVGNLTEETIEGWELRLLYDASFRLTGSDGRFFVLADRPGELDLRPTAATLSIDAHDAATGEICYDPLVEPYAVIVQIDAEPGALPTAPLPGVPGGALDPLELHTDDPQR